MHMNIISVYIHANIVRVLHKYYTNMRVGADSKLELAFTIADGLEYIKIAQLAGELHFYRYIQIDDHFTNICMVLAYVCNCVMYVCVLM